MSNGLRPVRTLWTDAGAHHRSDTVRILLEEEIHHGAEIGVLRDLHRRRQ